MQLFPLLLDALSARSEINLINKYSTKLFFTNYGVKPEIRQLVNYTDKLIIITMN